MAERREQCNESFRYIKLQYFLTGSGTISFSARNLFTGVFQGRKSISFDIFISGSHNDISPTAFNDKYLRSAVRNP